MRSWWRLSPDFRTAYLVMCSLMQFYMGGMRGGGVRELIERSRS